MDKYLLIILAFMIAGIPISLLSPTGNLRAQPQLFLFYGSIAGIIAIIIYSSYKDKKQRQKTNAKRRSKK